MIYLVRKIHHHINKIIQGITSRGRNYYYRFLGVRIKGYIWVKKIEIPHNYNGIQLDSNCALDRGVTLICSGESLAQTKIIIGANTYINRNTLIDAIALVKIGCDCAIGPNCYLTDHDHGLNSQFPPLLQPMVSHPTTIGDRVWIGANVTILKGVEIGDDAVIGAGSVVTQSIPQNAIAVGVPAKVIKKKKLSEIVC